jgi:integrase/recombinase XerC
VNFDFERGVDNLFDHRYNDYAFDKYHYHKHKGVSEMQANSQSTTLQNAVKAFIEQKYLDRSANTARTYKNAMSIFLAVLTDHDLHPDLMSPSDLSEDTISWFASDLKVYAPATERLYLTAVANFFQFLSAERLAAPNLPRVQLLIRQRSRRPGVRLPQFPADDIENILDYAINVVNSLSSNTAEKLRTMRDRAFLLTLADTGLRVHEACALRRGDIDWNEGKAIIIGKGDRQAVIRFSNRSLKAIKEYIALRSIMDGGTGKPLGSLPVFARHDKGAGKKTKSITTATGRNIVSENVRIALGEAAVGTITPHSFRHYFVTTVLRASGNLKLAQELARHKNIAVTQRYAHLSDDELDRGYAEIFDGS